MDYLNTLSAKPTSISTESAASVLPPGLANASGPEKILGALRRQQLHDLARAYGLFTPALEKLDHLSLVKKLAYCASEGVFNRPPSSRWHFEKARYDSDLAKLAKYGDTPGYAVRQLPGGQGAEIIAVKTMLPWDGPDDKPATASKQKPTKPTASMAGPSMAALRDRARELGISSFGKSRRDILSQISAAESATAATVEKDTTNA